MIVLAIESSCDETAVSLVRDGRTVLADCIASQVELHRIYGGVVPEIASRKHIEAIYALADEALERASLTRGEIDAVAVTYAPGLIGAVLVGVNFAKGAAKALQVPLIPVHHIRGHIAANYLAYPDLKPPFLCLVVSGGHSLIVDVQDYTRFSVLGTTRDDAAGECFDKVARVLGMPYPGGAALRQLMGIPSNYKVLFLQGGGTLQFSMVPLNLMNHGAADYIVTGAWSQAAQKEACKFGIANVVASSADRNYTYLPDCSDLPLNPDADYVYICENETIHGTTFSQLPNTKGKALVSDQSSMFLSKPCNVADYGLIFAGVQKNVGPAGMSIVIIRDDLISQTLATSTPTYLQYAVHASSSSMYNTPNCWSIYVCGKVFQYLIDRGGLAAMQQRNEQKANLLYDYLDHSRLFRCPVEPASRSMMNVPFVTPSKELDAQVVAYAQQAGLENPGP